MLSSIYIKTNLGYKFLAKLNSKSYLMFANVFENILYQMLNEVLLLFFKSKVVF